MPERLGIGVAQIAARESDVGQHTVVETGKLFGRAAVLEQIRQPLKPAGHMQSERPQRVPERAAASTASAPRGTTPPVILSSNLKPEPRGSGLMSSTTSPNWPWPPDCFLWRPRSWTDFLIVSL